MHTKQRELDAPENSSLNVVKHVNVLMKAKEVWLVDFYSQTKPNHERVIYQQFKPLLDIGYHSASGKTKLQKI